MLWQTFRVTFLVTFMFFERSTRKLFWKKMFKNDQCNFPKVLRRANTKTQAQMFCFYRKTLCDLHYMFVSSTNNGFSTSIKISGVIKNLNMSANSVFLFSVIELKRKRKIGGISRKGHIRRRQSDESHFFCKESIEK